MPQREAYNPGREYLEWHAKEVFKGPGAMPDRVRFPSRRRR